MTTTCQCPADGFCPRYQRTMSGRARQICQGVNIEPANAAKYRDNWEKLAKQSAEQKARYGAPGDELKTLLTSLGQQDDGGCGCDDHAAQMNAWGVLGCKSQRTKIIGWLIDAAKKRGVSQEEAEAAAPWLVDEAIRRAESKMQPPPDGPALHSLAAITCYFNPQHYARPLANYRRFRDSLESAGVPLYTIELAFDDDPFEIEGAVQIRGSRSENLLWQKERLLNLLLPHVPAEHDAIAWIDADVLLTDPAWPQRTLEALSRYPVVQLFREAAQLLPDKRIQRRQFSTGWAWATRQPQSLDLNKHHPGYAWAGRADWLRKYGLHDSMVSGGGDSLMIQGFTGQPPRITPLPSDWRAAVAAWAGPVAQEIGGQLGYVDQRLLHLWHGERSERRYIERWEHLLKNDFAPSTDIKIGESGLWEWTDAAKHEKPAMVTGVASYFEPASREAEPLPPPRLPQFPRLIADASPYRTALSPLWQRRIDTSSLPFEHVFNCSLLERHGRRWLVFRGDWGPAKIGVVELDREWRIKGKHKILSLPVVRETKAMGGWWEDPRIVQHDGQILLTYAGVETHRPWQAHVCLATLDDDFNVVEHVVPRYAERNFTEKNWSWFSHGGELYCVYHTAPAHRVLRLVGDELRPLPDSHWSPEWWGGHLRGGASPVLHNDEWYSFIHGTLIPDHGDRLYTAGLYTFADEAPFAPRRWIPGPILAPNLLERPQHESAVCVFPCGALFDAARDEWVVSYGLFDHTSHVAGYAARDIERALQPAPGVTTMGQHYAFDLDGTIGAHPQRLTALAAGLRAAGHRITVLTAAAWEVPPDQRPAEVTRRLQRLGFTCYDELTCIEARDKGKWCAAHGVDVLIDDSADVHSQVQADSPATLRLMVL